MPEPHLRASDADRAAVATALGEHMAAGRLTLAEFEERVGLAFEAKTYGGLAALTADLPPLTPSGRPVEQQSPGRAAYSGARRAHSRHHLRYAWAAWLRVAIIVMTIWLITSAGSNQWIYPWPIWVIGPWGAVLLSHTLGGRGPRPPHRSQLPS
jgi:hypothetical protein